MQERHSKMAGKRASPKTKSNRRWAILILAFERHLFLYNPVLPWSEARDILIG